MSDRLDLTFDASLAMLPAVGLSLDELCEFAPQLHRAWREVVDEDERLYAGPAAEIPAARQPLDHGFVGLPERLLRELEEQGDASEVARIEAAASRLAGEVDRVVVLGIGGSYMGARALMDACCRPYFNELSREARGGRPRMYFEGNNVDNDASQGLLDLLQSDDAAWGLAVISKSGGTLETAVAFRQFLHALQQSLPAGERSAAVARRVLPVTGREGRLRDLSRHLQCQDVFDVPEGVGGRFSVFSAVGLLPAALLGLDIRQILAGAASMTRHFREASLDRNIVLNYASVSHLMEVRRGATVRVMNVWAKSLESVGLWYDQLLAESLGKHQVGATPITAVNTRDLHSRAQQHQQGRYDKLLHNLVVDQWNRDPLPVGSAPTNDDQLDPIQQLALPRIMQAAVEGVEAASRDEMRASTRLTLSRVDEHSMGQLLQMLMLATVVEGRLLGVNPYGQPGVQAYKNHMTRILFGK